MVIIVNGVKSMLAHNYEIGKFTVFISSRKKLNTIITK